MLRPEPKYPDFNKETEAALSNDRISSILRDRRIINVAMEATASFPVDANGACILSFRRLQDQRDYRAAIRDLFGLAREGDYVLIVVPHAFLFNRQLALPSHDRPQQLRLYSPSSLLGEVEEALEPNSYRVRLLADLDDKFHYEPRPSDGSEGLGDIALLLEAIAQPSWRLASASKYEALQTTARERPRFEVERTLVRQDRFPKIHRILIMKLDHLGDLVMGLPALTRIREHFPESVIDLVVGSWNADLAAELGLADRILSFDAFPRNSSEEEPNVDYTVGLFREVISEEYDLAIDLRTDLDTRVLLRYVRARLKAGIGTRARFPYLDIALPLDETRNDAERVRDDTIEHWSFAHQGSLSRTRFGLHSDKDQIERDCGVIWGPYLSLEAGDYAFEFFIDILDQEGAGLLQLDVALHRGERVAETYISGPGRFELPFRVDLPGSLFEARVFTVDGQPSLTFNFHGGRLIRRGPRNVLHQAEYASLLVELVRLRTIELGLPQEITQS